MALER
ncbi:hypothetical protein ZEAMMB73_Zm00001d025403 [Zea mays]